MFSDDFRKAKSGMVLAIKTAEELQRQLRLTTITNVINVAPKCAALRPFSLRQQETSEVNDLQAKSRKQATQTHLHLA